MKSNYEAPTLETGGKKIQPPGYEHQLLILGLKIISLVAAAEPLQGDDSSLDSPDKLLRLSAAEINCTFLER